MTGYKLMLLGEIGVGKSSLARRLVFDKFEFDYKPTIGVDVYRYDVPDTPHRPLVSLIIWDTDGNFGDSIFRHVYMKEAQAALIIGDITRPQTIDSMKKLGDGFDSMYPGRHIGFALNKIDLAVDQADFSVMETSFRAPCVPTSALTGAGIASAFSAAADALYRRKA
jgi:Ras-related protein Rab-5C